jgi:hypothetical protein
MPTTTITPWEFTPYVAEPTRAMISALLWALHDNGGSFKDASSGLAGPALRDLAVERGMFIPPKYRREHGSSSTGLSSLYAGLEQGKYGKPAIERDKSGTRTFEITLLLEDEEMPPKPAMVKHTLGDSTKPIENPVDVSRRYGVGPVETVEHIEVEHLEDGWDDIDDKAHIETLPAIITVSDTPAPYGLVLDAQRAITRALVTLAKDMPPPADHVELIALRARVGQLTQELNNITAERDRLAEILNTIASADTPQDVSAMNGAAS